jgi:hypothetical protein
MMRIPAGRPRRFQETSMTTTIKWTCAGCLLILAGAAFVRSTTHSTVAGTRADATQVAPLIVAPPAPARGVAQQGLPASNPVHAAEAAVQKAREQGAGENEVYRLRAAAMSAQQIALITEREEAEKKWQLRLAAWRAERARLSPAEAAALRERRFSPEEQVWLDASEPAATPQLILK